MRWTLSWMMYWIGDTWWSATEPLTKWFCWPYRVYSRLMNWSLDIQGPSENGPWKKPI